MNKRIEELAEQCRNEYLDEEYCGYIDQFDYEKFAELIVKECARCVTTGEWKALPPYDRVLPIVLEELATGMKNHFGVN